MAYIIYKGLLGGSQNTYVTLSSIKGSLCETCYVKLTVNQSHNILIISQNTYLRIDDIPCYILQLCIPIENK